MINKIIWYFESLLSARKFLLYQTPIKRNFTLKSDYRICKLDNEQVPELINFYDIHCRRHHFFSSEEAKERLRKGHLCYIAYDFEGIIGFCWYAVSEIQASDLHCTFLLSDSFVAAYNMFVKPDMRGKGVLSDIQATAYNDLFQQGYRNSFCYILSNNFSSIRANRKIGAVCIGKIICGYYCGYYLFTPRFEENTGIKIISKQSNWYRFQKIFSKFYPKRLYK